MHIKRVYRIPIAGGYSDCDNGAISLYLCVYFDLVSYLRCTARSRATTREIWETCWRVDIPLTTTDLISFVRRTETSEVVKTISNRLRDKQEYAFTHWARSATRRLMFVDGNRFTRIGCALFCFRSFMTDDRPIYAAAPSSLLFIFRLLSRNYYSFYFYLFGFSCDWRGLFSPHCLNRAETQIVYFHFHIINQLSHWFANPFRWQQKSSRQMIDVNPTREIRESFFCFHLVPIKVCFFYWSRKRLKYIINGKIDANCSIQEA